MTDLNTFLLQEATQAASEGREPCFHYSPTLATAIIQVHQRGVIEDSLEDGQEFLDFIDNIGHQFHPFNSMKVFAVSAVEYDHLDPQQKFVFSQIMEFVFPDSFAKFYIPTTDTIFSEIIGEGSLIVNDQGGVNRLFLGPVCNLHIISPQTNFNSLSPGRRQLIPNFRLPPGQTWARFQTGATLASVESEDVSEESSSAPKKSAERIPRPPNPFIIYRAAHHKSVAIAHPEDSNNEICKYNLVLLSHRSFHF